MDRDNPTAGTKTASTQVLRQYTPIQELINNIPYIAMTILGSIIFVAGFGLTAMSLTLSVAYFTYGAAGAIWIMIFVCPFCHYFNTRACPCGYGHIAVYFRNRETVECFSDKFKRHIPVIVPLWFIPPIAGIIALIKSFSWSLLFLLVVFSIVAFVVLPLVSTKHGCKECPQKETCPWMKYKT